MIKTYKIEKQNLAGTEVIWIHCSNCGAYQPRSQVEQEDESIINENELIEKKKPLDCKFCGHKLIYGGVI